MNTNVFYYATPGRRLDIVATARATFRISVNKEPICEVDFEVLYDMLKQCAWDSKCARPGFRRRRAELIANINRPSDAPTTR